MKLMNNEDAYAKSRERYPDVRWPMPLYEAHANVYKPNYPIDLYLGGAAGHRLTPAWNRIHSDFSKPTQQMFQGMERAGLSPEELWHETILKLLKEQKGMPPFADGRPPARMIRYRGKITMQNFLILVGMSISHQMHRTTKAQTFTDKGSDDAPYEPEDPKSVSPLQRAEDREAMARVLKALDAVTAKLSPRQRFLICLCYDHGMPQNVAAKMLRISNATACRCLADARDKFDEALKPFGKTAGWSAAQAALNLYLTGMSGGKNPRRKYERPDASND